MYKNHTKLIFFFSILIMLASLATLVFFWKIIENKNKHTSNVLVTLSEQMARKENASELTEQISEITTTQNTLNSYFVDSKEIDSFLSYLESLGIRAGAGIEVKGFDTSTTAQKVLVVNLEASGNFQSVMRAIILLENAPYQIHITKTYLSKETNSIVTEVKEGTKTIEVTSWRADISFSVLISS